MIIKKNKKGNNKKDYSDSEIEQKSFSNEERASLSFKERQERRRGDRRRGYRRIDDRNIISKAHEEAINIKEKAAKEGFEHGLKQLRLEVTKISEMD